MHKNYRYFFLIAGFFSLAIFSAEEEGKAEKKLPVGSLFYLSNSVGAGTVFKGYEQKPMVSSALYIDPYFKTGPFWGERQVKLHSEISGNFEWLSNGKSFVEDVGSKFTWGDLKIRLELLKALELKDIGLKISPALKIEVPTSKSARVANRVIGLGGFITAKWSKWGFFFTYKPLALSYIHSANYKSDDCSEESIEGDKLGGGQCKVAGRQTMLLLKNTFYTGYEQGNHALTLGFRTYHHFLRASDSGEKPEKTPISSIKEATLGFLEYGYTLPIAMPTVLAFGVQGYQAPYDADGAFRMPFFNFSEPSKNETEAYLALEITI